MKKIIALILVMVVFAMAQSTDKRNNFLEIINYIDHCSMSYSPGLNQKYYRFSCSSNYNITLIYSTAYNYFVHIEIQWKDDNISKKIEYYHYEGIPRINDLYKEIDTDNYGVQVHRFWQRYNDKDFEILPLYLELKKKIKQ